MMFRFMQVATRGNGLSIYCPESKAVYLYPIYFGILPYRKILVQQVFPMTPKYGWARKPQLCPCLLEVSTKVAVGNCKLD
jgi:hypothetical protein